jgi:hypothetical protein
MIELYVIHAERHKGNVSILTAFLYTGVLKIGHHGASKVQILRLYKITSKMGRARVMESCFKHSSSKYSLPLSVDGKEITMQYMLPTLHNPFPLLWEDIDRKMQYWQRLESKTIS